MGQFRIRDARGGDREAIAVLWRQLMLHHQTLDPRFTLSPDGEKKYIRHVQDMMRSSNARLLVAEEIDNGEIVAYMMGELQSRAPIALPGLYGFVSDICVAEEWRHQGVGRALFDEMKRWFKNKRAIAVELYVAEANAAASSFWKEMGLEPFLKLMHLDL